MVAFHLRFVNSRDRTRSAVKLSRISSVSPEGFPGDGNRRGHPVSLRSGSPAFVVARLIRSSALVCARAVYTCDLMRAHVRERSCARDSCTCVCACRACRCVRERVRVASRSVYPGFRARVAKLVMYLTWDNRRRQVS